MNLEEFPILVGVRFTATVADAPWDYEEAFVHEIEGTLRAIVNENQEQDVGTIKLLKISLTEATNRQISWANICDSHSDFLVDVYDALFGCDEETKEDLDLEAGWNELLVLDDFNVEPEFRQFLTRAFETAISFFAASDLIVAVTDGSPYLSLSLTSDEWKEIGFVKIAGTQIAVRDNCRMNPYKSRRKTDDDEEYDEEE